PPALTIETASRVSANTPHPRRVSARGQAVEPMFTMDSAKQLPRYCNAHPGLEGATAGQSLAEEPLMLRLSRRLRPVSGSRCFNSMQIRGQGRLLPVFLRAFRVHRRLLRWILNSPRRSFKQRALVDR